MTQEPKGLDSSRTNCGEQDAELIRRTLAGDDQAFDLLVTRYRDRIGGLIYHRLGDGHEAEDLTQEVFLRAYFGLHGFRGDSQFFTWLYRITLNVICNQAHRLARRRQVQKQAFKPGADLRQPPRRPDEEAEENEEQERVLRILDHLAPPFREVMFLREVEGRDLETIAQLLGVARGTVKSRLFRAREDLRVWLLRQQSKEKGADRNELQILAEMDVRSQGRSTLSKDGHGLAAPSGRMPGL